MVLQDTLALIAQGLLIIALPIVIAAAVQHYRVMSARLRSGKDAERWEAIQKAVQLAAIVAEQTGLADGLIGPAARQRAIKFAQDFLDERGVHVDVNRLATLIESEIRKQVANPTMPADSPMARHALLQAAVDSAVLAAEQSGLAGHIQNIAVQKKAYAMQMARQYLQLHGLQIADELISGLIEAQLLRLHLASQGQTPSAMAVTTSRG